MTIHPILIVEDDAPTQMLLQTLMQRYGYATVTAPNGQAAIDALRQGDFTVVVLDLMMPEVSGHDVIAFLGREKKDIPVILCTAAGPDKTSEFDTAVVRAVLRKPFDVETLMATIFGLAAHTVPALSKVLIVHDDPRTRYVLKALLEPAAVLEADSVALARVVAREQRPEAVLLGTSLVQALDELPGIPVVVIVSGELSDGDRARLMRTAAAVIDKSALSRQTLVEVMQRVLRR